MEETKDGPYVKFIGMGWMTSRNKDGIASREMKEQEYVYPVGGLDDFEHIQQMRRKGFAVAEYGNLEKIIARNKSKEGEILKLKRELDMIISPAEMRVKNNANERLRSQKTSS